MSVRVALPRLGRSSHGPARTHKGAVRVVLLPPARSSSTSGTPAPRIGAANSARIAALGARLGLQAYAPKSAEIRCMNMHNTPFRGYVVVRQLVTPFRRFVYWYIM